MRKLAGNRGFWVVTAMMLGLSVVHYSEWLGLPFAFPSGEHFGLSRHSLDRVLFLIPILYAGHSFRIKKGLIVSYLAFLIMLPRCIFLSTVPLDALMETDGIVLAGVLACFWFESQHAARDQRRQAKNELETIHESLQTQIRLSRSNAKRLATLNAISGMVSGSLEPEHILRGAIDMSMEVMEVELALIFVKDDEAAGCRLAAYEGISGQLADEISRLGVWGDFNEPVLRKGKPYLSEDVNNKTNRPGAIRNEKLHSLLTVPLRANAVITGTLCVGNRRPRKFLPEDVELLAAIGAQIGIAMENTKLYHKEQLLAAQYRGIFENATEAIWQHNLDGNILTANRATTRLTGYEPEHLARMNAAVFLGRESLAHIREAERRLLLGEIAAAEPLSERVIRKDGSDVLVRLSLTAIHRDGHIAGFQYIAMDITRERQMEENLRHYIEAITRAQEQERKRIARELHDETVQQLIALSHQLDDFSTGNPRLSDQDIESLTSFDQRLKDAMKSVRIFSRDLRPPMIDDLGLVPALEWFIEHFHDESKLDIKMNVTGTLRRLAPETELTIFRIIQEALNNIRRHAEASVVTVTLEFEKAALDIAVKDNGKGFRVPDSVGDFSRLGKLGLTGMEERARLLGGELTVASRRGEGTLIRLRVAK